MLKLYNTLSRKKEEFKPIKKGLAGLYSCGPTVYWYQHIGNLRTYVFVDVLKRVLMYDGFKVKHVMNITDVGHLTSDADVGEDKMVKALKREGLPLTKEAMLKLAKKYTDVFKVDLKKLNIIEPDIWAKATEHIKDMIELVKKIEKNTYTYKTRVGLIFDTSKFKNYTELGRLKLEDLKKGARGEVDTERKNPSDFALWITNQPKHLMQWDSPWGKGFPGWHLECSAMAMKYLGDTIDIHTGGEEHIPVHHTNEIAQSEAATGKKFVNYWLHARWLLFKGGKMAKSKGEIYTLSELEKENYKPIDYRYFCFTAHYRTQLEFSHKSLGAAKNSYERLRNLIADTKDDKKINKKYLEEFEKAVNDDLDMPKALSILWRLVRDNKAEGKIQTIKKMDKIFALDLLKKEKIKVPEKIKKLVQEREKARKKKNFKLADKIRKQIKGEGYIVEDTDKGPKIKRA